MPLPNANGALVSLYNHMSAERTEPLLRFPQIRDVIFEREGEEANMFDSEFLDQTFNLKCDHEGGALVCAREDVEFFILGELLLDRQGSAGAGAAPPRSAPAHSVSVTNLN